MTGNPDGCLLLRPSPERGGACPRCDEPLELSRLRLPGWRMLFDGDCPSCGHRYLQDLPFGHGLLYPATLDVDTGETFQRGSGPWFAAALRPMWVEPDSSPVELAIPRRTDANRAVLLNCLDKVYGHSLLKLLNAARYKDDAETALAVLVPESLAELVPDYAEAWIVRAPSQKFSGWLLELEQRLPREIERFDSCLLSPAFPHPHPSTYELDEFLGGVEPQRRGDPSVVLSLRADRPWGGDEAAQHENVARLADRLRDAFPKAHFTAIGAGTAGHLPEEIEDLSTGAPGPATERHWLGVMLGADLAIGVHGSNMLLPSGLARSSVELIPAERYGNAFQATLPSSRDAVAALVRHRTLYGADDLADLMADRVADVAISILRHGERTERLLTGPAAGQGTGPLPTFSEEGGPRPSTQPALAESLRNLRPGRALRRLAAKVREGAPRARRRRRVPALPWVARDERGLVFELETTEEVDRFTEGGHAEAAELALVDTYLEPGMTAFDVGANIGIFTATFARAVGPTGEVHSFEPLPAARRRLESTLELNGFQNVIVSALAVAEGSGTEDLHDYGPGYESWASLAPREIQTGGRVLRSAKRFTVGTISLDGYCANRKTERIDLLKVDVEGAEERALRGAARLLGEARIGLIVLEVADTTLMAAGTRAHRLIDLLEMHGLWPYALHDNTLRPFRVAGEHRLLTNVVAASQGARARLTELGFLSPP